MELVNSERFWRLKLFDDTYYFCRYNHGIINSEPLFYDRYNKIIEDYNQLHLKIMFEQEIEERRKYFGTN